MCHLTRSGTRDTIRVDAECFEFGVDPSGGGEETEIGVEEHEIALGEAFTGLVDNCGGCGRGGLFGGLGSTFVD